MANGTISGIQTITDALEVGNVLAVSAAVGSSARVEFLATNGSVTPVSYVVVAGTTGNFGPFFLEQRYKVDVLSGFVTVTESVSSQVSRPIATFGTNASGDIPSLVDGAGNNALAEMLSPAKKQNIGTRILGMAKGGGGPIANAALNAVNPSTAVTTTGQFSTFGAALEVEAEYDWVRFFISNSGASVDIKQATVLGLPDISTSTAALNNAGFASAGTFLFNGSVTATLPAGTANVPALLFSDKLKIASVARTDGGVKPAVGLRLTFTAGAAGAATQIPYFNRSGADWNVDGATPKVWTYQSNSTADDAKGTISASPGRAGNSPIYGVQYGSRRNVATVLWVGDSILGGASLTNSKSSTFAAKACLAVSTAERPVEFIIGSHPGGGVGVWRAFLDTAYAGPTGGTTGYATGATNLDVLSPTHMVLSSWSVNDAPSTTVSNTQIQLIRHGLVGFAELAQSKGMEFAHWNGIPRGTGTTYYTVGGDVTERQAYNTLSLSWGYRASNFGSALSAQVAGVEQGIVAGYTSDGLHPNDAGDNAMVPGATNFVRRIANGYFGQSVTTALNV